MCTRQECFDKLNAAAPHIRKEFGVTAMSVFGSMARGDNHPGSDVDVFVEMGSDAYKMLGLKSYLQGLLGTTVDLVTKHPLLGKFFLNEIRHDGIVIFS